LSGLDLVATNNSILLVHEHVEHGPSWKLDLRAPSGEETGERREREGGRVGVREKESSERREQKEQRERKERGREREHLDPRRILLFKRRLLKRISLSVQRFCSQAVQLPFFEVVPEFQVPCQQIFRVRYVLQDAFFLPLYAVRA